MMTYINTHYYNYTYSLDNVTFRSHWSLQRHLPTVLSDVIRTLYRLSDSIIQFMLIDAGFRRSSFIIMAEESVLPLTLDLDDLRSRDTRHGLTDFDDFELLCRHNRQLTEENNRLRNLQIHMRRNYHLKVAVSLAKIVTWLDIESPECGYFMYRWGFNKIKYNSVHDGSTRSYIIVKTNVFHGILANALGQCAMTHNLLQILNSIYQFSVQLETFKIIYRYTQYTY